jgi:hypothetical protein
MHAWVIGILNRHPSGTVGRYLRQEELGEGSSLPSVERMLEYSDVVLFDFLVDGERSFWRII